MLAAIVLAITPQAPVFDYAETLLQADAALVDGDLDLALDGFEECAAVAPLGDVPLYGIACVHARAGRATKALDALELLSRLGFGDAELAAWDPDLRSLRADKRFQELLQGIRSRDRPTGPPRGARLATGTTGPRDWIGSVAMDSGDRWIACVDARGEVELISVGRPWQRIALMEQAGAIDHVAFCPQGDCLAGVTEQGILQTWSLPDGELRAATDTYLGERREPGSGWYGEPIRFRLDYSPVDCRLLCRCSRGGAVLVDRNGEVVGRYRSPSSRLFKFGGAWSPDGSRYALGRFSSIVLLDGSNLTEVGPKWKTGSPVTDIAYSPDGRQIVTSHSDSWIRAWSVSDQALEWSEQWADPVFGMSSDLGALSYSPDGQLLAYVSRDDSRVSMLRSDTGETRWISEYGGGFTGAWHDVCWSPSGNSLWFGKGGDGWVRRTAHRRDADEVPAIQGRAPASGNALGVVVHRTALIVVELETGKVRWSHVATPDGPVLVAPSGHFQGTMAALQHLERRSPRPPVAEQGRDTAWTWGRTYTLDEKVFAHLSPKRVRACIAGVTLHTR